jgi:hypothetical protein
MRQVRRKDLIKRKIHESNVNICRVICFMTQRREKARAKRSPREFIYFSISLFLGSNHLENQQMLLFTLKELTINPLLCSLACVNVFRMKKIKRKN